jgi:hypothetical protein
VGSAEGVGDGACVGRSVGCAEGSYELEGTGVAVGAGLGTLDGDSEGIGMGAWVGVLVAAPAAPKSTKSASTLEARIGARLASNAQRGSFDACAQI